jgi:hypothetical protein
MKESRNELEHGTPGNQSIFDRRSNHNIQCWLQYALDFMPRGDISEMPDTVIIPTSRVNSGWISDKYFQPCY